MNDLIQDIDKLHTTSMGAERIKRNLNLETNDIVTWCKETVKRADIIIGQGKNWYVYKDGVALTINTHSYTIITAHKINAKVCVMRESDYACLPEFRGYGIGSKLMKKPFYVLRKNGYGQTSLSVQKDNPAVRFYQRLGYKLSGEKLDHPGHEDFLMIKKL